MEATIGKKQVYITITPTPIKDIVNGLRVHFHSSYRIAVANIKKGQRRYYLPKEGIMKVVQIEICE